MILHNQTPKQLNWEMGGQKFACEPWGPVDVPDQWVELCAKRTLPLGQSPVPAESKASVRAKAAQDTARSDEVRVLKGQLEESQAVAVSAQKEAEDVKRKLTQEKDRSAALKAKLGEASTRLATLGDEKAALELKLEELAGKLADLEKKATPKAYHNAQHQNRK
jgi:hypothetical protein